MASKGRPYRTVELDGFEVLIGRGARENDELTFRVGTPADFWLHVGGGTAGSHVVVRNPDKLADLPRGVLERAAAAAAWYSKARAASKVEVHYCRVVDVSKPRGAKPGLVQLRRFKRVKVRPENVSPDDSE